MKRELPRDAKIVLNIFETKLYPWKRLARRHIVRSFPNLWRGFALNPYIQFGSLADTQVSFEREHFFPDQDVSLPDTFRNEHVYSANSVLATTLIDEAQIDLLLIYGTQRIHSHVFMRTPLGAINAHGGLLPGYRGLDTNLWAALEGAPEDMAVTIHQVDVELDTGPLHVARRLGPIHGLELMNLRYYTAILCTDLFLEVVERFLAGKTEPKPQEKSSRYFGPMPELLKRRANRAIKAYAAGWRG